MFKNPFSFEGRIRRTEYGLSILIMYAIAFITGYFIRLLELGDGIIYIILIPLYWFIAAQGAKRSHDRGNSGWYQIIPLYILFLIIIDGEKGKNKYGPNPKGIINKS